MKISNSEIREQLNTYLIGTGSQSLDEFVGLYPAKKLIRPLFSAICSIDDQVKWRAVTLFGHLLGKIACEDIEYARVVMRRFLWSLNDESGGIGWGAPETMAEAMCAHPGLRSDYLHMLCSYIKEDGDELFQDGNHLELPELQRGVLWGLWRVAQLFPDELLAQNISPHLAPYLASEDSEVVGLTLLLYRALAQPLPGSLSADLLADKEFCYYSDGSFHRGRCANFFS